MFHDASKTLSKWQDSHWARILNGRVIVLGLLGIILLIVGMFLGPGTKPSQDSRLPGPAKINAPAEGTGRTYEEVLEGKLANILSQVQGAGTVTVTVTLETGPENEFAKNTVRENRVIQEKDTAGGTRTTTETKETEQLMMVRDTGGERPVLVKETKPVIKGVLVVAEGAGDSFVKAQLTRAVEAALGVPPYKITVLPQRR